jgi:hypothetical protein
MRAAISVLLPLSRLAFCSGFLQQYQWTFDPLRTGRCGSSDENHGCDPVENESTVRRDFFRTGVAVLIGGATCLVSTNSQRANGAMSFSDVSKMNSAVQGGLSNRRVGGLASKIRAIGGIMVSKA